MKQLQLLCFLPIFVLAAAAAEFPTPGVLNPVEGTIEFTLAPEKPASEFENEWAFVFDLLPVQSDDSGARTLLGLCISSGENGNRGLFGVVRNPAGASSRVTIAREAALNRGVPVNVALSWSPADFRLHLNGREVARDRFNGGLGPMPGSFRVSEGAPFFPRRMRVSNRVLPPEELASDPAQPFRRGAATTLITDFTTGERQVFPPANRPEGDALRPVFDRTGSVTANGEPAALLLNGANSGTEEARYRVELTLRDPDGVELPKLVRNIVLPPRSADREIRLEFPLPGPGVHQLRLEITGPDRFRNEYAFSHLLLPPEDRGTDDGQLAGYIGHHLHNYPELLRKLGIRWSRSDAFHWYMVEPEPGKFDWRATDRLVEAAEQNGVRFLGLLGTPPAWAADPEVIRTHKNADMAGRRKPHKVEEWENYVFQTVSRYRGRVPAWEVWNEVDWHPPAPAASFSGSTAEYLELLKAAHRAIRRADPDAVILVSGFGYGAACDQAMPFDLLKLGAADYCDFYNVHSYQGLHGIEELQRAVEQARPGMKLWQTEQMWHTIADPGLQAELTAAIQFWFLERGFEKYFSFGEDFFFSHWTRSPIPALGALANVQNELRKCDRYLGRLPEPAAASFDLAHRFRRTDGSTLTVLGRSGMPARWQFRGDVRRIRDLHGRNVPFTRQDGVVVTDRPAAFLYLVGDGEIREVRPLDGAVNLCPNGTFEEITGDVATGGMANAAAARWQLREKNYDPAGKIAVVTDARSGKYALRLTGSGAGRVYAFFDARVAEPGVYRFSGHFRNPGSTPVAPYVDVFDRNSGYFKRHHLKAVEPGPYRERSVELEIPASRDPLVFSVGIEQAGSLILDDLELGRPEEQPETKLLPVTLAPSGRPAPRTARLAEKSVSMELLASRPAGKTGAAGFKISDDPILLSAAAWKGIRGAKFDQPLDGAKFQGAALLAAAAYVPEKAGTLARVRFRYRDGSRSEPLELRNRRELRDWFLAADSRGIPPAVRFVSPRMLEYGLFRVEAPNPHPERPVEALELEGCSEALLIIAALSLSE